MTDEVAAVDEFSHEVKAWERWAGIREEALVRRKASKASCCWRRVARGSSPALARRMSCGKGSLGKRPQIRRAADRWVRSRRSESFALMPPQARSAYSKVGRIHVA